jgi:hypothetical protein
MQMRWEAGANRRAEGTAKGHKGAARGPGGSPSPLSQHRGLVTFRISSECGSTPRLLA